MVEFAIILPLMLLILFGMTELGRALYQQNVLYKAVSSGSRYLARATGVLDTNCAKIEPGWTTHEDIAQNLIIYGHTTTGTSPLIPNLDSAGAITITPSSKSLTKTLLDGEVVVENVCIITVTARAEFLGVFGEVVIPFTEIGRFNIRAETEERYIGL